MSTENRNKVLLGFGALVAVVIVAIALWPANFRKEDASGAIGAVQKHRAPQITQKDVILGDENVRHQQKVLYADFLADAGKLRSMAASKNYDAAIELSSELRTRYAAEAEAVLAQAEIASRTSANRAKLQADIAEVQSRLKAETGELSAAAMRELNGKLALIIVVCTEEMGARSASRIFNDAGQELAAAAKRLETAKLESDFLAVAKEYQDVESMMSRPLAVVSLADEEQYLVAMQVEMKVAADAENLAVRKIADQEIANRLSIAAQELEQRAVNNIKANAELMSEMNVRLSQMNDAIELAGRALGTRAGLASRGYQEVSSRLNAVRSELGQREDEFFAQSKATASEELAAARQLDNGELATRLANLQTRLQSRQQQ